MPDKFKAAFALYICSLYIFVFVSISGLLHVDIWHGVLIVVALRLMVMDFLSLEKLARTKGKRQVVNTLNIEEKVYDH